MKPRRGKKGMKGMERIGQYGREEVLPARLVSITLLKGRTREFNDAVLWETLE